MSFVMNLSFIARRNHDSYMFRSAVKIILSSTHMPHSRNDTIIAACMHALVCSFSYLSFCSCYHRRDCRCHCCYHLFAVTRLRLRSAATSASAATFAALARELTRCSLCARLTAALGSIDENLLTSSRANHLISTHGSRCDCSIFMWPVAWVITDLKYCRAVLA